MLRRTHLAIGLAIALHFSLYVQDKFVFFVMVLLATLLPDIDSKFSWAWRMPFTKPAPVENTHRGLFHSYTFCIPASIALAFVFPVLALPFFFGYSFHIFADSFTPQGIRPFWPMKQVSKGPVTTGSKVEDVLFWIFVMLDAFLAFMFFVYL